jgi:hypothetical protein
MKARLTVFPWMFQSNFLGKKEDELSLSQMISPVGTGSLIRYSGHTVRLGSKATL